MAAISRDEVANLARLARISMSDAELDHLAGEMDVILGASASGVTKFVAPGPEVAIQTPTRPVAWA